MPVIDHNDETIVIPFDIKDYPVIGKDAGYYDKSFEFQLAIASSLSSFLHTKLAAVVLRRGAPPKTQPTVYVK